MNEDIPADTLVVRSITAGANRENESCGLGMSTIDFKVGMPTPSDPFILKCSFHSCLR